MSVIHTPSHHTLRALGLGALLCLAGSAMAAPTCTPHPTTELRKTTSSATATAANWSIYAPASPDEQRALGLTGLPPTLSHGQLVACQTLSAAEISAYGVTGLRSVTLTRHVVSDAMGKLALGSAAVYTPAQPATGPDGGQPTIVINTPTAGIAAKCGPTVQWLDGGGILKDKIKDFIGRGFTVVVPDYLGLGVKPLDEIDGKGRHPYLEGKSTGRSVLDAILAAKPFMPSNNRLAMQGYSQGGAATVWAAHLAASYAPSLTFTAVRAGGVVFDVKATVDAIWARNESEKWDGGLTPMALVGMMNATDPATRLTPAEVTSLILQPEVNASHMQDLLLEAQTQCRPTLMEQSLYKNVKKGELSLSRLYALPNFRRWAVRNSLNGLNGNTAFGVSNAGVADTMAVPSMPFMLYHVDVDEAVPYPQALDMVQRVWQNQLATQPKVIYTSLVRTDRVWFPVTDVISHGLGELTLYNNDFSSSRYTPEEWLFDSLYRSNRLDLNGSACRDSTTLR